MRARGLRVRTGIVGLAALVGGIASIVQAADVPPLRSDGPPKFTADVVISLHADGRPALGVSVAVPYDALQWLKTPKGYAATAEFTVVFEPGQNGAQVGDVWDRSLLVPEFRATVSPVTSVVEKRTFDVPPGRHRVRVEVRDLNSDAQAT